MTVQTSGHPEPFRPSRGRVGWYLVAALVVLGGCDHAPPDNHPGQPVTRRKLVFKEFTRTLEPMGLVARDREPYQPEKFLVNAQELARLAPEPWGLFPPDSNYPPSRAKPAVWELAGEFRQAQMAYEGATQRLLLAAQGREIEAIRKAVNDVQDSCTACHKQFRNK